MALNLTGTNSTFRGVEYPYWKITRSQWNVGTDITLLFINPYLSQEYRTAHPSEWVNELSEQISVNGQVTIEDDGAILYPLFKELPRFTTATDC